MIHKVQVVTGTERRRRFSHDEKVRMLEEASQPGSSIIAVSRKYGVARSLLQRWKKMLPGQAVPFATPELPAAATSEASVQHTPGNFIRLFGDAPDLSGRPPESIRIVTAEMTIEFPASTSPARLASFVCALRR